ncbi:MAG: hypothetical protein RLZZ528_767 [Pseudomonadota bacterium]
MPSPGTGPASARKALILAARIRGHLLQVSPARLLFAGYLFYALAGWAILSLPLAQTAPLAPLDTLFTATSALSTTGLATVDTGTSFTGFGQAAVLVLIQLGGLGYMTVSSFVFLAWRHRLSGFRVKTTRAAFGLPETVAPAAFLGSVVVFTLAVELVGAFVLSVIFYHRGVEGFVWQAVFHSVSAFCTAGFSLFPTSLEAFRTDANLLMVLSVLSILSSVGFLIVTDIWTWIIGRAPRLGYSSRVILTMTTVLIALGTVLFLAVTPAPPGTSDGQRVLDAFFQAMSASTTVGFNSVPIGGVVPAAMLALMALMLIGASPAGTGGGLKTTSVAALWGVLAATLTGRSSVSFRGATLPDRRIRAAVAAFLAYILLSFAGLFILLVTEAGAAFEALLFEVLSALSTVGLSMGVTGALSDAGKAVIVLLMFAGRVGVISFGLALTFRRASAAEEPVEDIIL